MFKEAKLFDLVIGIVMTIMGVYVWLHPMGALAAVSLYLGIAFLIAGIVYIIEYITRKHERYLSYGILNTIVGIIIMSNASLVATSLSIILALWILFTSILQITASINFKKLQLSFWIYPLILGILGTIFSFIVLQNPQAGILTIAIIIGTYMIIYGVLMVSEYFLLKDLDN